MNFRVEHEGTFSIHQYMIRFHHGIPVQSRTIQIAAFKQPVWSLCGCGATVSNKTAVLASVRKLRIPGHHFFQSIICQVVVRVHCEEQFTLGLFQSPVDGTALSAVFLPDIPDGKGIGFLLPAFPNRKGITAGKAVYSWRSAADHAFGKSS